MAKIMSQSERVLQHMQRYGSITTIKAWNLYGITRPAARIKNLRDAGMTLEEVVALQEGNGDVWIEETAMPGVAPWIIAATLVNKIDWQELGGLWFSGDQCYYANDYNLNTANGWRCWTSRPTDEQRRAVKWG